MKSLSPQIKHKLKICIFSFIPLILLLVASEVFLRVTGFKYSYGPMEMRAQKLRTEGVVPTMVDWTKSMGYTLVKDAKQFWVPSEPFAKGYKVKKGEDVVRIATLGDSCTASCVDNTDNNYPMRMESMLNKNGDKKYEVLNAAVGSYSSFQGLQRFKHEVLRFNPDIITVYFGWNDHWITIQQDKHVRTNGEFVTALINYGEKFRTFQLVNYLVSKATSNNVNPKVTYRVPPKEYEANLKTIVSMARDRGMKVIFITAAYDLSEFKPFSFFPFPKEKLIPIHKRYNDIVRMVAREHKVPLVDLAFWISMEPKGKVLSKDGIHFTKFGCDYAAETILKKMQQEGML